MITEQFIAAHPSYFLEDAIKDGIAAEEVYGHLNLGPVDTLDPTTREAEYALFFGSSPHLPIPVTLAIAISFAGTRRARH